MSREKPPTAISEEDNSIYEEQFRAIGRILRRDAEQIMERWFERAVEEAIPVSADARINSMNELLDMLRSIGLRLDEQSDNAYGVASEIARHHGRQRLELGWEVTHVVRDYEILHGVVLEHLGEALPERLTYRQAMIIATVMDRAIGSAVQAFSDSTHDKLESHVIRQQAELRQLTLDLTEAEQRERKRIAKTLHDDFQQLLVAARMKLEPVKRAPSSDSPVFQEMQDLLDRMLGASRDLSRDLYPSILDTQNLPVAMRSMAKNFQEQHSLTVTVDLQVSEEANPGPIPLRRLIFDGVRELLFNIVKHGQTDQAWIRISETGPSEWRFEIEDRGVGFSRMKPEAPAAPTGLGLSSMRHRIEKMGARSRWRVNPVEGRALLWLCRWRRKETHNNKNPDKRGESAGVDAFLGLFLTNGDWKHSF